VILGLVGSGVFAIEAHFGAVGQAVVVRVRVQDVDQLVAVSVVGRIGFVAVFDTVVVAVGVLRIAADSLLFAVGQAVLVVVEQVGVVGAVGRGRVGFARVFRAVMVEIFRAVLRATVVGVGVERVGLGGRVGVGNSVRRVGLGARAAAVFA
jgi:hypothetical protein